MSYATYALVRFKSRKPYSIRLACHPEMLRAGLKAFRAMDELRDDIAFLEDCFPSPRGSSWLAVNGDGEFCCAHRRLITLDMATRIYRRCDEKTPHVHKYAPFLAKVQTYAGPVPRLAHYADWASVTTQIDLEELGVEVTLEAPRVPMRPRKL